MVATKQKAGPLMKPYFIGFLGFPEAADESPSLPRRQQHRLRIRPFGLCS
jgi:hypothetical protein